MSIPIKDFWRLAVEGRLLTADEAKALHTSFTQIPGAAQQSNAATLAEWLVAQGAMSRYQTQLLLARRAGPFAFGEYKIREPIKDGRFKGCFKATHAGTGHNVLLQFLSGPATQDPHQWSAITREGQIAAAARHPHLSRMYELVDLGDYKFVVCDELAGASIAERLSGHATTAAEACRIVRDAALGLARLHELGQAHGDVRPSNIWVEDCGTVRLLQFPLARDPLTPQALNADNADYAAPELVSSGQAADSLADLYSLGCTLYELCSGRAPFAGGDMNQKFARHLAELPMPLEQLAAVPPAVAQIAGYLMAKDAGGRYQAAAHVAEALTPFAAPLPHQPLAPQATLPAFERYLSQPKVNGSQPPAAAKPPASAPERAKAPTAAAPKRVPTEAPAKPAAPAATGASAPAPAAAGRAGSRPVPLAKPEPEPIVAGPAIMTEPGGASKARAGAEMDLPPIISIKPKGVAVKTQPNGPMLPLVKPASTLLVPKKKSLSTDNLVIGGVAGTAVLAIVGFLVWKSSNNPPAEVAPAPQPQQQVAMVETNKVPIEPSIPTPPQQSNTKEPTSPGTEAPKAPVKPVPPPKPKPVEVDDDGETLWVSPTSGDPLKLSYLPSGGQVFIALRPSEILAHPEGAKVLAGLGPGGLDMKAQLEAAIGLSLADDPVEQVIVALYPPADMGPTKAAYLVRLKDKMEEASLLARWKDPGPQGQVRKYFQNDNYAYFIPPEGDGRVFSVLPALPPDEIKEIIASDEPPALRKEMEKMLKDSDASRHFTLMVNPSYIFTDGTSLFAGNLDKLRKPLMNFLGDGVQAAMLSMHLGDNFFVEMRAYGSLDQDAAQLAKKYREKLGKVPDDVEQYYVTLNPSPYGRLILTRFPQMIRLMENYTRTGEENKQAVLRCYLPGNAGHNLVMGTELSLAETPGAAAVAVAGPAGSKQPTTPAEALQQKISLSFPRDTLEKTMIMLGEEIKWEIVILGGDLQLEGITKNQSFGLDERDKPAGEILRTVMMKANPDGKLIYVFKPKDPGGKDVIFITTRASAAKRGDKVPPELEQK